ncbi:LA2681 family HEPN domain-containing protein [Pseudophaeobacter sp.]|uniref:LA2681 family HEPN domain-containing protein n=1 Tax=Pseudophaeobacter sp. TaxID=1971739 RepID=UPI00405847A5
MPLSLVKFRSTKVQPSQGRTLSVTIQELEQHTLHMMKLARSAIMGLSLAVYHQENHLKENKGDLVVPVPVAMKRRPEY